ncbi:cytochrome P450 9b2-like [Scaptodrosophila lebanonensis]|uniref:Cytochrome P450 9b2-like n=1 Tax=Drosophila lebanonensis TaxID=7225 RepID=A0A6J2UH23_DROLE|nr:cytochrome P450 9b2-like [Scaptodrosophila lebanonensis]
MGAIEIVLLLAGLLLLLYKWATATHNIFEERGLPYEKPWPLVGNIEAVVRGKASFQKFMSEFYARTRQHKLVGFFNFRTPMIQINDPEIIKKLTVKDFDHFPNHQPFFTSKEPLLNDMLSVMKDQRWKHMRNTLTPVFTSSKMRNMFGLMNESFAECMQHLGTISSKTGEGFDVELKDVCNRLSNDLIATTAFGLKVNSYKERDNQFYQIGQSVAFFRGKQLYKFMLSATIPWLFNLLGFKIFDSEKTAYFMRLVVDTMKYREENKIVRPDMIQLLMEAKKEASADWTDEEIVAQCFIFFFAAFENNASLICTTAYELLNNPHVQQTLYQEVQDTHDELGGKSLTYDAVQKMPYMDMVVSESLRKWALAAATDRLCSKDYVLRDDDGTKIFEFKVGDRINIPIAGLHWDERYFPDPLHFEPERFSESQKDNLVPYTYLPFGVGPRNCIGNRYALMQAKAMLYNLLLVYKIERSPKTVKNLMDHSVGFQLTPKSGYWVHLVPRK